LREEFDVWTPLGILKKNEELHFPADRTEAKHSLGSDNTHHYLVPCLVKNIVKNIIKCLD